MVIHDKADHVHIFRKRREILPHAESPDSESQTWYLPDGAVFFACCHDRADDCWDVYAFSMFGGGERYIPNRRIPLWVFDAIPDEAFANLKGIQ